MILFAPPSSHGEWLMPARFTPHYQLHSRSNRAPPAGPPKKHTPKSKRSPDGTGPSRAASLTGPKERDKLARIIFNFDQKIGILHMNTKVLDKGKNSKASSRPPCPQCGGHEHWKHGANRSGKQQYKCRECGRIFVTEPYIDSLVIEVADRMLQADIKIPVMVKILKGYVSRTWIYKRRSEICQTKE